MKKENSPAVSRILVRLPNWLGDNMMATPAVLAIKEAYPDARLTVLAKSQFADFWNKFPGVDEVLSMDRKRMHKGFLGFFRLVEQIRKKDFDLAVLFTPSFSSAFMVFAAGVPRRIGFGGDSRDLFLTDVVQNEKSRSHHVVWEYLRLVRKALGHSASKKEIRLLWPKTSFVKADLQRYFKSRKIDARNGFIALSPLAAYGPTKRWPMHYWKELIEKLLAERKESLFVIGGEGEGEHLLPFVEDMGRSVNGKRVHLLSGETPLALLASLLDECELLVTNDTGPSHVAAAVGTPVVALFGSTPPDWSRPFGLGHEIIYKHLECSPCFQKTCPIGYKCLNAISVEEVFRAVQKMALQHPKVRAEKPPKGLLI